MYGFNSRNETIQLPPREVMPPILRSDDLDVQGIQMFTITAYFKHPKLICSPIAVNAHPGKGLYIQRGYDVEHDYEKIPMESKHLSSEWKKGSCRPQMGVHYFKKLSREMPCELLYPVFLMYNQDGLLGAFGWLFQGSPHFYAYDDELSWFRLTESTYPFIFDETMLPSCMFNPQFRVFGLSIYLRNKDTMICPIITQTPAPIPSTTTTTTTSAASYPFLTRRPQAPPPSPQLTSKPPSYDDTIILDEEIRKQSESAATVQRPDYWLVCLWAAVVGALVWLCIPDLVQVRTDT
ncbi:hypothetical protein C0Q70_04678 [Pomacea canaliculata]|uniref:Uncharacterized protein n=2 Tax=Pomacea canaliculata TaxID=400727 RepID=A0A2T7PJ70_POMCA|nr:hypothetical protein C0Q70_04678 [Pomacea canaliculata]